MNKKCQVSTTVVILLLLLLVTFAGTTFYIWYTNYLKKSETSIDQVPAIEVATIMDIGNDKNTFYVTVRNNKFQDITVPKSGHVIGVYKGSGSTPCSLSTDPLTIKPKESGVATIPFNVKSGTKYYIVIEVIYEGKSFAIMQYYTRP